MRARAAAVLFVGLLLIAAGLAYFVSSTSTGSLVIQVRDIPNAWSHVLLTFAEVRVLPAGAANGTGWLSLPLAVRQVDFLALGNLTQVLALDHVAPGWYASVQIVVASASGVLSSGQPVAMSVSQGILEAPSAFLVRGGARTTVTVDLNLSQSIRQTSLGWVFSPVLGPTEYS